jgi:hypothetical protein
MGINPMNKNDNNNKNTLCSYIISTPSTTPMNGSMEVLAAETENCQPEVPQGAVFAIGPD